MSHASLSRGMLYSRCLIQSRLCRRGLLHSRSYSAALAGSPERVTVPCKNNGSITLDVYRSSSPEASANDDRHVESSILLYLPPGPVENTQSSSGSSRPTQNQINSGFGTAANLAKSCSATVVQVNYRLSPEHRFPTPIHDLLAGYDWAVANLVSEAPKHTPDQLHTQEVAKASPDHRFGAHTQTQKPNGQIRVGVCGELIGGTLALSLALSECRFLAPGEGSKGNGGRVVAAAVNNPIVNWTFQPSKTTRSPEKPNKRKTKTRKDQAIPELELEGSKSPVLDSSTFTNDDPISPAALTAARKALFHPSRPADWFDPFASPILFLRTPGIEVATAAAAAAATTDPAASLPTTTPSPQAQSPRANGDVQPAPTSATADLSSPSYAELAADDTIDLPLATLPPTPKLPVAAAAAAETTTTPARPYKPRRLPRKWPPASMLPTAFPSFRIGVAAGSAVEEQGTEMAGLLRRALGRFEFPGIKVGGVRNELGDVETDDGRQEDGHAREEQEGDDGAEERQEAYLLERIVLEVKQRQAGDVGWDAEDVEEVGRWFEKEFARES